MKIYVSGPMSGIAEFNHPEFNRVARALRERGYSVINPAEINTDTTKSWHECIRADLKALCDCDAICLIDGWENSQGAHLELHMAHRIGLRVVLVGSLI
jgi:hypothetical protein